MLAWHQLSELAATCYQPFVADIHHALEVAEKISSNDGESHRCQQEAPGELLCAGVDGAPAVAPALEWCASVVTRRGPVCAAADLWGMMLKALPESTRYLLELAASTR